MNLGQEVEQAQAALDQEWANAEQIVDSFEAIVAMAKSSIVTVGLQIVVNEIRVRRARRLLENEPPGSH